VLEQGQRIELDEQRVAVGPRLDHLARADQAVGACCVVDDHGLAPDPLQLARDGARLRIGAATRAVGNDEGDLLVGLPRRLRVRGRAAAHDGDQSEGERAAATQRGESHADVSWVISMGKGDVSR
jgi:hypothetical protein